jgi:hypothetical protein
MQQHPDNRAPGSTRTRKIEPVLLSEASPAPPVGAQMVPVKKRYAGRRAALWLLALGIVLELVYLALYPLLASAGLVIASDPVQQALPDSLPWLPGLYWTQLLPGLTRLLALTPWLDPANTLGSADLLLILLALASALALCAANIGWKAARGTYGRLSRRDEHALFWIMLLLTALFGATMLCAPVVYSALSQDMLLYGLYGRMVVIYHVNPYTFAPAAFSHDLLPGAPLLQMPAAVPCGPVWMDLSILATLPMNDSVASIVQGFRLIGLVAHLLNAILLWLILAERRPVIRISATLLYAWNPLILMLSVTAMHQEVVVITWLLLAIFFLQRKSLIVGWIFALLAALTNPVSLLLLPLFLHVMAKKRRIQRQESELVWWFGVLIVSGLLVALTYAPYWQGWSLSGIAANIGGTFQQGSALNSLDAAVLNLPMQLPSSIMWLLDAHQWSVVTLVITGVFLLMSLWLADTLELTLLCGSWLLLLQLVLLPTYWPWYALLPFVLALCSAQRATILLAAMLLFAALIGYYCWLRYPIWTGQGLLTVGLPLLLWGWTIFFISTWRMMHRSDEEQPEGRLSRPRFSRPPWLSLPSRPGNRG